MYTRDTIHWLLCPDRVMLRHTLRYAPRSDKLFVYICLNLSLKAFGSWT